MTSTLLASRKLRIFLLSLLACMLVAFGNAQMRATVVAAQLESGGTRLYETEVHAPGSEVTVHREARMGRKPYDHPELQKAWAPMPRVLRIASRDLIVNGCRAPPYAPRAPPTHS